MPGVGTKADLESRAASFAGLGGLGLGVLRPRDRGSIVVPFWGSYLESYKVIPKRNYYGAFG